MHLSRCSQYAIRALMHLAEQEPGRLNPVRQIASRVGIPLPFLNKILSSLSRHGMITTRRGPNGGVMLARPPDRLTIGEVVAALDGSPRSGICYLGLKQCSEEHPCPVHDSWMSVQSQLERSLYTRTFDDLTVVGRKRPRSKRRRAAKRRRA